MPTVQWLLRTTNRTLRDPAEYLTGKAHPSVFDASTIDEHALVEKAHQLTKENLPPLVNLHVVEETRVRQGADYFDPGLSEQLADSPGDIARVFRSRDRIRRLLVSAAESIDLNAKPLTFRWVVLRGDETKITITPQNKEASVAELNVGWQPRRPIALGSPLESNRIDIGVFANNGTNYSPPAFITFLSLDNETRTYDDNGRPVEIIYHRENFVDPRLSYPKEWRDVYRYDSKGRCLGWTRYQGDRTDKFNLDGFLVREEDALGRAKRAQRVHYQQAPHDGDGWNTNPLSFVAEAESVTYSFANDDDIVGRVTSTAPIDAD